MPFAWIFSKRSVSENELHLEGQIVAGSESLEVGCEPLVFLGVVPRRSEQDANVDAAASRLECRLEERNVGCDTGLDNENLVVGPTEQLLKSVLGVVRCD